MKQLKPRDKVTQHMTRDGLTLDNQTTGESINMCPAGRPSRNTPRRAGAARRKKYWNGPEDTARDRQQGKESGQGRREYGGAGHRPRFPVAVYRRGTGRPRAGPVRIKKAEKRADKLEAAKEALPKKRVVTTGNRL